MTIESKIEELTVAINKLTQVLGTKEVSAPAPVQQPAQSVVQPEPPKQEAPAQQPVQQPVMPAAPEFLAPAAPVQQAPAVSVPFDDIVKYATESYQFLESQEVGKGAKLQGVMGELGIASISDAPRDKWADFYAKVEALKNA